MRFILLLLLTVSSLAFGQRSQTIDADCLRIKDGICVDKLELGYLDGLTGNIKDDLDLKADADYFQNQIDDRAGIDGDETLSGIKTINGAVRVFSTDYTSLPCPVMTETQRNALVTVITGDCIYNSSSNSLNVYNGTIWKTAGGGLSNWETSFSYAINDIVIESNKIYQCLTAHTSGTFATDLAATKWLRVSTDLTGLTGLLPLSSGGTNKNATASNGAIAYSDTDSLELLAPGIPGQVLQTNGTAAPSFVYPNIGAKAENTGSFFMEELQVPNNQLTTTDTNKYLLNDCGSSNNLLANCGFEHSTPATGWTLTNGSSAVETSNVKQGKKSLKLTLTAQALDFYQTSILNVAAFADGVNGSISLAIKTTVDNVYLCRTDSAGAVVASTDGTKITNCIKVPNSGKWSDLLLPVILGATSNGMRLVSLTPSTAAAVAVTGDVYVDQGILEAGLKATSQGVCTDVSCMTEFSAKITSAGVPTESEGVSFINGSCSVSDTSLFTCTWDSSIFTVAPTCTVSMAADISGASQSATSGTVNTTSGAFRTLSGGAKSAQPFNINCKKSGADFTNAKALASGRIYTASCGANCVDSFSAVVTDGVATTTVSKENAEFITGNCTNGSAGVYQCTVSGFTVAPNCTAVANGTGDRSFRVDTPNATTVDVNVYSSAGALSDSSFTLTCQKTGVDFVASRTIVGSFAEVVTSQGTTSPDIQSVYFGSSADCSTACTTGNCTICNQVGSKITSVSFAFTGQYNLNGIDGTKYNCTFNAVVPGTGPAIPFVDRASSTSSLARVRATNNSLTATNTSNNSAICLGKP